MVGGCHGMLLLSSKYSGQTFWWENTLRKAVRNALWRTSNTVWSNGRISTYFCERPIWTASVWSKSLARYISRLCLVRWVNLERRHSSSRHWSIGRDGRIRNPRQKAQCKGRVNADERWQWSVADGTMKTSGGDRRLRPSTWIRDHPERGEEQEVFRGESDGLSFPNPLQDDSNMGRCGSPKWFLVYRRRFHLSSSRWTQSQTVRAERRKISYSVEVHRRYQNNTYVTWRIVEKQIDDYWNVDGQRELSDAWTGFTSFILLNERPPDGYTWSRGRLARKQTTSRPDNVPARFVDAYVWCCEKESKTKMSFRETKTRQCHSIERNTLYWAKRWRIQAHNQSRA